MSSIQNGNSVTPPELENGVMKVVLIGEPRCGKTRFIRAYYDYHHSGVSYSYNGVRVYPCKFADNDETRRVSIFEIPSNPDFFPEQRIPHYEDANIIVFLYAIDDPTSVQMLSDRWLLETANIISLNEIPVALVGNKRDLRNDQEVISRLAQGNETPVSLQQGMDLLSTIPGHAAIMECSAYNLHDVEWTFENIFDIAMMHE